MLSLKTPEKEHGSPLPDKSWPGWDGVGWAGHGQGIPGARLSASLGLRVSSRDPQLGSPQGKLVTGHSTHIHRGHSPLVPETARHWSGHRSC